jgi:hypothetical protein
MGNQCYEVFSDMISSKFRPFQAYGLCEAFIPADGWCGHGCKSIVDVKR